MAMDASPPSMTARKTTGSISVGRSDLPRAPAAVCSSARSARHSAAPPIASRTSDGDPKSSVVRRPWWLRASASSDGGAGAQQPEADGAAYANRVRFHSASPRRHQRPPGRGPARAATSAGKPVRTMPAASSDATAADRERGTCSRPHLRDQEHQQHQPPERDRRAGARDVARERREDRREAGVERALRRRRAVSGGRRLARRRSVSPTPARPATARPAGAPAARTPARRTAPRPGVRARSPETAIPAGRRASARDRSG